MVLSDHSKTGDGIVAALQVLASVKSLAKPLVDEEVQAVIKAAEAALGKFGRLVFRPSGTEPLIRVVGAGQSKSHEAVEAAFDSVCGSLRCVAE